MIKKITSDPIEVFWNTLKNPEKEALLSNNDNYSPVLFVGNGVTRLAKTSGINFSWYQWVSESWKQINPPISIEYAIARGLTLPECISYLHNWLDDSGLGNANALKMEMYKRLWQATELHSEPDDVHMNCIEHFKIIITTNYDTLLERACCRKNYPYRLISIGAIDPQAIGNISDNEGKQELRTIIKLHGSFPFSGKLKPIESEFTHWYKYHHADDLIASVKAYRRHGGAADKCVETLGKQLFGRPIVVLGYGMSPEDDLVIDLIERYMNPQPRVGMTFGGDQIDKHRFELQWGITHLAIPADRGGGISARKHAHIQFIKRIRCGSSENIILEPGRALLIGQSSINTIIRLERTPHREQAYSVSKGPMQIDPVIMGEGSNIGEPNLDELASENAISSYYETRQVGGQMLLPALFMNQWGIPVSLASALGYDQFGLEITHRIHGLENLDWHYLVQDRDVETEHSYITAFQNNRIMLDVGSTENGGTFVDQMISRIDDDIKRDLLKPRLIYLSKWFLASIRQRINEWAKCNDKKTALVLFETGNWGGKDPNITGIQIGNECDIILSSAIFTMRITRMPLIDRVKNSLREFELNTDIGIWDRQFLLNEPVDLDNRAYQYSALGFALQRWGLETLSEKLKLTSFGSATWWIITLGEVGIIALHNDRLEDSFWIKCPNYWLLNSSGCGDVARAAFGAKFMLTNVSRDEFLKSPDLVESAVRFAVAAGSLKGLFFRLDDALNGLSLASVCEEAKKLEKHLLSNKKGISYLIKCLIGTSIKVHIKKDVILATTITSNKLTSNSISGQ